MLNDRYVFGYDFGTISCRLLVVRCADGQVVGEAIENYPSGVISKQLPGTSIKLKDDWCLQDPDDYIYVLQSLSKKLLSETGIAPSQVIGIGIDFTNCTMLPIDINGSAMCQLPEYRNKPHAWVKLWKHHAAQPYAEILEKQALLTEEWICDYGNSVSAEWLFPKILQIYKEDPGFYNKVATFIEAADWVVYQMTGNLIRSSAILGVNAFWSKERGYPSKDFFKSIDPGFENVVAEKLTGSISPVGKSAGYLTPKFAELLGLTERTVVAVGHGDSEVIALGIGVVEPASMFMVMGTSTCYQYMYREYKPFDGLCAIVNDGMVPGYYSYEAGQSSVGDIFEWFVKNYLPQSYYNEANAAGLSIHQLMNQKADALNVGQSGLLSMDWFNGNRSILKNFDLTGLIMGLTLQTKPEEIYRALIEGTAFGAKVILDSFTSNGLPIKKYYVSGGLARNSPFVMQLYTDVIGEEIIVPKVANSSAFGAAVCAAVAASRINGGYDTFNEAVDHMTSKDVTVYKPDKARHKIYTQLYEVYKQLHDYFGTGDFSPMKKLRKIYRESMKIEDFE